MRVRAGTLPLTLALFMSILEVQPSFATHSLLRRVSEVGSTSATGDSSWPSVSSSGVVAFSSWAANLAPGDVNGVSDVFVRDMSLAAGVAPFVAASISSSGSWGNGSSGAPSISAGGRYVAFESAASNFVADDTNGVVDVFRKDLLTGATIRVSVGGGQANDFSSSTAISADGRYVAFESGASNLVSGDANGQVDVFVRDVSAGLTSLASISSSGVQANGPSYRATISGDGRFVAFESGASNLILGDANGKFDVFVRDRTAPSTEIVSVGAGDLPGLDDSGQPSISPDGRFVAFSSNASNLVIGDSNLGTDVLLRDRELRATTLVSVSSAGVQADGSSGNPRLAVGASKVYVMFDSYSWNLDGGAPADLGNVYLRDIVAGTTTLYSRSLGGQVADADSRAGALSPGGRWVAFSSNASNLVSGDIVGEDVFLADRGESDDPTILAFRATPSAFSPNQDGIRDETLITATISDASPPVEWTLDVRGPRPLTAIVARFTGSGDSVLQAWGGANELGVTYYDGIYEALLTVVDHWGNVTSTPPITVTIDRVRPVIERLVPSDHAETRFGSQPLLAKVSDEGSGVDGESGEFQLFDRTANSQQTVSATYNSATGWLKSSPLSLLQHDYQIQATVRDLAGNVHSLGQDPIDWQRGGFGMSTLGWSDPRSRIAEHACVVSDEVDLLTQEREVRCLDVQLEFGAVTGTLTSGRHEAAVGYTRSVALLASARLLTTPLLGIERSKAAYPAGSIRTLTRRFSVSAGADPRGIAMLDETINAGTLVARVPASWTTASLVMPWTPISVEDWACSDPSSDANQPSCEPDPLLNRFVVTLKSHVTDPNATAALHATTYGLDVESVFPVPRQYRAWIPPDKIQLVAADAAVDHLVRDLPGSLMAMSIISDRLFSGYRDVTQDGALYHPTIGADPNTGQLALSGAMASGMIQRDVGRGMTLSWGANGDFDVAPLDTLAERSEGAYQIGDDNVFFPLTWPETDMILHPMLGGVEIGAILRSSSAPTSFTWRLLRPEHHFVVAGSDEEAATIEVVNTQGSILAFVTTLRAIDANGQEVPLTFNASGGLLALSVPHRDAAYSYPIVVDPDFSRQMRTVDTITNGLRDFWVRGYLAAGCLEFGTPCTAGGLAFGPFMPEYTAQAKAIRTIAGAHGDSQGGLNWSNVDWEVSPVHDTSNSDCPSTGTSWRADIVTYLTTNPGVAEVKVYSSTVYDWVEAQLNCYQDRSEEYGWSFSRDTHLNQFGPHHSGINPYRIAWAVSYPDNTSPVPRIYYAWTYNSVGGEYYYTHAGHIYFATLDNTPPEVRERAQPENAQHGGSEPANLFETHPIMSLVTHLL